MAVSAATRVELYYASRLGGPPQGCLSVPGRAVLLGEHIDHQGGRVLAVPLERGVHVAFGLRPDRRVTLHALNAREIDTFDVDRPARSGRRWADMARGVFARSLDRGWRLPGVNLVVYGDLPPRQGLASSAAYLVGLLRAVLTATERRMEVPDLAREVAEIERAWGGVACGLMDPYVEAVGRPGEIVHLDTSDLSHEVLPWPDDVRLQVVSTGIDRRLDETPYNDRRRELARALGAIRAARPDVGRLVQLGREEFEALAHELPEVEARRARHVVSEVERVSRAVEAIRRGDGVALAPLLRACHDSLSQDFECSLPAIDQQVEALVQQDGVLAARLQGAGWGGSLLVLRANVPQPAGS